MCKIQAVLKFRFFTISLGTPIVMDEFGWSEADATFKWSLIMSATGVISFFAYIVMGRLTKRYYMVLLEKSIFRIIVS